MYDIVTEKSNICCKFLAAVKRFKISLKKGEDMEKIEIVVIK